VGVWAAFPVTLFAMILIQALGIQQGMWVFVLTLCVVGWGEVAQFVRGQVITVKPQLYVEAARAVGAQAGQILTRHVLPVLLPSLLVLAVLEMGGVLMLLAELGFLNTFLGGGFKVEIGEVGMMVPVIAYISDVPEWGAMLANIRAWWRSCPWMAWYPGVAFFLAIVTFNVWGEGLRRFLAEGRVNVIRLFNKYTGLAAVVVVVGLVWLLRSTAPLGVYQAQAKQFDAGRALEDIRVLASPEFYGRETGMPGADLAAEYIARRMKEIGLDPGGEGNMYTLDVPRSAYHLVEAPHLEILDDQGNLVEALSYQEDFVAYTGPLIIFGESEGPVVGLITCPLPDASGGGAAAEISLTDPLGGQHRRDPYGLHNLDLYDKVVLMREADLERINIDTTAGALVISDDPSSFQRKYLFGFSYGRVPPVMYITPEVADRLLATAGSSLERLEGLADGLQPGAVAVTKPGARVRLETVLEEDYRLDFGADWTIVEAEFITHSTIIGYIPGTGAAMETVPEVGYQPVLKGRPETPLSNQAIIISAYYDGVGLGTDGTLYPGANDNASGVATMLEIARVLKEAPYPPKRTVVFVAWPDGERYEGLSVSNTMNTKTYLRSLDVEAVLELSGVGAGTGEGIALGPGSSFRLVQLLQKAAGRMGVSMTTRGRGPHHGIYTQPGYGGRSALTAYISWDGSDQTAHTTEDTFETIDPNKLEQVGQTTLLALTVLSREMDY